MGKVLKLLSPPPHSLPPGTRMRCWQKTGTSCGLSSRCSRGSARSRERSWPRSTPGFSSTRFRQRLTHRWGGEKLTHTHTHAEVFGRLFIFSVSKMLLVSRRAAWAAPQPPASLLLPYLWPRTARVSWKTPSRTPSDLSPTPEAPPSQKEATILPPFTTINYICKCVKATNPPVSQPAHILC